MISQKQLSVLDLFLQPEARRLFGVKLGQIILVLGSGLGAALFEGFGLGMMLPVFEWIEAEGQGTSPQGRYWDVLGDAFRQVGVPITLATLLATAFLALLMRQLFLFCRTVYTTFIREQVAARLREQAFSRLLRADYGWAMTHGTAPTMNLVTVEAGRASGAVLAVLQLVGFSLIMAAYTTVALFLSWQMTLAAALIITTVAWALRFLITASQARGQQVANSNKRLMSLLLDRLRGLRLIKLANTEGREIASATQQSQLLRRQLWEITRLAALAEALLEPIVVLAAFIMLGVSVGNLGLSLPQIGLFFFIIVRLIPLVRESLKLRQTIASLEGSVSAVRTGLHEAEAAQSTTGGARQFQGLHESIVFRGVEFTYPGSLEPALRGVDLVVRAGRMTALVGPSGAGKSTLVDLLPRLRTAQTGEITLDGIPIEEFDLASLRRGIAFVSQDPILFNTSVLDNIRYVMPEASRAEVEQVARQAHAQEFISQLPDGYATPLGEAGNRLSGGERQRISLARAILQEAPLLVLDEPTSALDAESEEYIQATLRELLVQGVTMIVIAHRLSTIRSADYVAVIQRGQVVEYGKPSELARGEDWYAKILSYQTAAAASLL